ncbi:MAG: polyamine ABC transporter substrate-binding protein [Lachnospiraceae bacterium]
MKNIMLSVLTLSITTAALSGCGSSGSEGNAGNNAVNEAATNAGSQAKTDRSKELNLFTWEGMFPQEVLDAFTEETGIKVNYSSFDTDETMLSKLQTAGGGDYDVVIADDYIIETAIAEQLVQPLDKAKLDNWENINPVYQGQFFDTEDAYTVPYGAGVQTIVYNPGAVDIEINGYADLWDESLKDNLAIIGNYRVINGMALKVAGESYNTTDTDVLDAAGEKLLELAPNVRLIKDDNVQDDLISGEVGVAVMYTSQVTMACLADPELKVVYPEEGIGFGIMAQFIPVNAPHADAAYEFINYILRPEVAKQCFEYFGYYSTNRAADELIAEEYRQFLTLPSDFGGNTEMIQNVDAAAEEAHVKIWTKFKSACGQ